jgi:hypothetical protein
MYLNPVAEENCQVINSSPLHGKSVKEFLESPHIWTNEIHPNKNTSVACTIRQKQCIQMNMGKCHAGVTTRRSAKSRRNITAIRLEP